MFNTKELKERIQREVDKLSDVIVHISKFLYENPEIGSEEYKAAKLLTSILRENGFLIEKPFLRMATAFKAIYEGADPKPKIALIAEYDALPGLGHACGHNMIAAAAVGAAISICKIISEIKKGTIIVFGTPAEEGIGKYSMSKITMVKCGAFSGVDACMMIHPWNRNSVGDTTLALYELEIEFVGKSAHASAFPHKGINALDATILTFNAINALRQHVTPDVRIHGIISEGGQCLALIPERSSAKFYIRAKDISGLKEVLKKVKNCAKGAALATGSKVKFKTTGKVRENVAPNPILVDLLTKNMKAMGFKLDKPTLWPASTDLGNVSHVVPTACAHIAIAPNEIPVHTKEFKDLAISNEANDVLIKATKMLALTCGDLLVKSEIVNGMKKYIN
jgi:amidohydrolase